MTVESAMPLDQILAQPVPGQRVALYFADGSVVVRGGYHRVETALFGPLGVHHCFGGIPSPGLQHEIDWRGPPVVAAVGSHDGSTLIIDGRSMWLAPLPWETTPAQDLVLTQRTPAQLVGGPGLPAPVAEHRPALTVDHGPGSRSSLAPPTSPDRRRPDLPRPPAPAGRRPPPPVRPRRPGTATEAAAVSSPTSGAAGDPAGEPVPAPPEAAGGSWVDRILAIEEIRSRAASRRIPDREIRRLLEVLDRHGNGGVPFAVLAQEAGVAERRVPGYLAQLSEIVNIDGYEVVTVSAQSARFDRPLLERQLPGGPR